MGCDPRQLSFKERLLVSLAMPQGAPEIGATVNYTIDNCLGFARRTLRDFDRLVTGKTVLDYGCGHGWQAVAMRVSCQAERVLGLDVSDERRRTARRLPSDSAARTACTPPGRCLRNSRDTLTSCCR